MSQLVAESLFINKSCFLPGIGTLWVEESSAESDFVNGQILPPTSQLFFSGSQEPGTKADSHFDSISNDILQTLTRTGKCNLPGIGVFYKDDKDEIQFIPIELPNHYLKPVTATRVIREQSTHTMIVGDKETTNSVMSAFYSEKTELKDQWWIWAAAIAVVGVAVLAIYIGQYGINTFNASHLSLPATQEVYHQTIQ